ncbi:MAG: hypothetical protein IJ078_07905 [Succinivibrionaceae bacterium]|uniref:hypothetical protein n=1 Tax=Ruminobacter sp. TaxID=2774296 RepID=UPI003867FE22|nr:hypothetical protein [Succinivibrionaceae bacterium]
MLIDEKDLFVLANESSRKYFRGILQAYYNQNYRAAVVMLYAFVMYDLLQKLKIMAQEGDLEARNKLKDIQGLIEDDKKYSIVEDTIRSFFKERCSLYFRNFDADIDLLKTYRNKCAHLNLNDDILFEPKDYHVRMLICSMFDHILSAKAPFIRDLFEFVKDEIERYENTFLCSISVDGLDKKVVDELTENYYSRLTLDSIKRSYCTFIKLLFISKEARFIKGLYIFTYSMTDFLINKNIEILFDTEIKQKINQIQVEELNHVELRKDALVSLVYNFPQLLDLIEQQSDLFDFLVANIVKKPKYFHMYNYFFARSEISPFAYFKNNVCLQNPYYIDHVYKVVNTCQDFDLAEFVRIMVTKIPNYDGFDSADRFAKFFIDKLPSLDLSAIQDVLNAYYVNRQCLKRKAHKVDIEQIKTFCDQQGFEISQFEMTQASDCDI